jgi:hypothetical protein
MLVVHVLLADVHLVNYCYCKYCISLHNSPPPPVFCYQNFGYMMAKIPNNRRSVSSWAIQIKLRSQVGSTYIQEVRGPNMSVETISPDWGLSQFSLNPSGKCRGYTSNYVMDCFVHIFPIRYLIPFCHIMLILSSY